MSGTAARSRPDRLRRVSIAGHSITVDDEQPTFWDRVERGDWEPGTLATLALLLAPGATFLDVGAWVGPLSLLAAAQGADVLAIEADPVAEEQFRRNLAANPDLAPRIKLLAAAVSPDPAPVRLGARRKPGDSMSSTLLAEGGTTWTVPGVTPAMLAERLARDGSSRLVIKIDIEGGEYALLPHLGPLLSSPDVALLVSFHPRITRETGSQDPVTALQASLAAIQGWQASSVEPDGPHPRGHVPDGPMARPDLDTWLFRPP